MIAPRMFAQTAKAVIGDRLIGKGKRRSVTDDMIRQFLF
jgi:hypothetical protein